jgi:hypothetical protein
MAMTASDQAAPALYAEPGSTWWPLVWGPAFAVAGAGAEALSGSVHTMIWVLAGAGLAVLAFVWVQARRRVCAVRLTATHLYQGREAVAVDAIADVDDVGLPVGARVLGGGWTVPRKFGELPIRLTDKTVVLAWAQDVEALRAALRPLVHS